MLGARFFLWGGRVGKTSKIKFRNNSLKYGPKENLYKFKNRNVMIGTSSGEIQGPHWKLVVILGDSVLSMSCSKGSSGYSRRSQ